MKKATSHRLISSQLNSKKVSDNSAYLYPDGLRIGKVSFRISNFKYNISHPMNLVNNILEVLKYIKAGSALMIYTGVAAYEHLKITPNEFHITYQIQTHNATTFNYIFRVDNSSILHFNNIHIIDKGISYFSERINITYPLSDIIFNNTFNRRDYQIVKSWSTIPHHVDMVTKVSYVVGQLFRLSNSSADNNFEKSADNMVNAAMRDKELETFYPLLMLSITIGFLSGAGILCIYLFYRFCIAQPAPPPIVAQEDEAPHLHLD